MGPKAYRHLNFRMSKRAMKMIPKPIPDLTKRQWDVLARELKGDAPPEMQRGLREAKQIASQIREE